MESPSQWPGITRSSISGGRTWMLTISGIWPRRSLPLVGRRALKQDRLARMAQREYGDAWEILEQLLRYQNPFVQMLLDRPFEGSSSEPEDIPRPWDSCHELAVGDAGARLRELARLQRATLCESMACIEAQTMAGSAQGGRVDVQPADAAGGGFADFGLTSDLEPVEMHVEEWAKKNVGWACCNGFWRGALILDFGKDLPSFARQVHLLPARQFVYDLSEAFRGPLTQFGELG